VYIIVNFFVNYLYKTYHVRLLVDLCANNVASVCWSTCIRVQHAVSPVIFCVYQVAQKSENNHVLLKIALKEYRNVMYDFEQVSVSIETYACKREFHKSFYDNVVCRLLNMFDDGMQTVLTRTSDTTFSDTDLISYPCV